MICESGFHEKAENLFKEGDQEMEQTKDRWVREYKNVTLKLTDGSIMKGKINIRDTGRLSNLLRVIPDIFIQVVPEEGRIR